jgi:hypothetical protein
MFIRKIDYHRKLGRLFQFDGKRAVDNTHIPTASARDYARVSAGDIGCR